MSFCVAETHKDPMTQAAITLFSCLNVRAETLHCLIFEIRFARRILGQTGTNPESVFRVHNLVTSIRRKNQLLSLIASKASYEHR